MRTNRVSAIRWGLVAAAAIGGLVNTGAQAQTTLRWKFQPGEGLGYVSDQSTKIRISDGTKSYENALKQTIDMRWRVASVSGDSAEIVQTFDRIRTSIDSPVAQISYDSRDGKAPEGQFGALGQVMSALAGAEISFKISPLGEVSDVKLPEKMLESLKSMPGAAAAGSMLSEESIKKLITQSILTLPAEPLSPGQSWTKTTEVQAPQIGNMALKHKYTFQGPADQGGGSLERIGLEIQTEISRHSAGSPLDVKEQTSSGTYLFDNRKGHLDQYELTQKMVMGTTTPDNVQITQSNETTSSMRLVSP